MADELISRQAVLAKSFDIGGFSNVVSAYDIATLSAVDAVEVTDKELRKAINLLIKQYEHSKNSDYVHSPVAHAFFHTWKQLDNRRREENAAERHR